MSVFHDYILPIVAAGFGTLGFSLLFHIAGKRLLFSTFGGMLTWTCYLLVYSLSKQELLSYGVASACASLYAQGLARANKAPATMFRLPAVIPLVPGGALYATMQEAVLKNWTLFGQNGIHTLLLTVTIALGFIVGELVGSCLKIAHTCWETKKCTDTNAKQTNNIG